MRLGWDMKREQISSLGSIQRGNKRWENIHHELRRRKLQELWWFQVEELKVSREIWTDHNEIVNHLPVSLMQVEKLLLPATWKFCSFPVAWFGQAQSVKWLAGWPRSPAVCGFWLDDSKAKVLHLFHTLFVINWNMGSCARYHGHWNIVPYW